MSYPIYRAESRERFEQMLREDARNEATTEFLPLNPKQWTRTCVMCWFMV